MQGHTVTLASGARIHYHEVGQGPAVVFIHGSGPGASGRSNFAGNAAHLARQGFWALMPDSIGYGGSDKPADATYTLDFFVDHLLGFLDAVGIDRCVLVGNSMGGAMAIRAALRAPERVEKLVLMAPGGLEAREVYMGMRGIRRMLRCIYGPEGITRQGMVRVFALQLYDASLLDEAVIDARLAVAKTQPLAVFKTMSIPNQTADLQRITCPVLGFWGADDQFCPPSGAQTLAAQCPDAVVVLLSRCGHWVMVEHAARFNALTVDFLRAGTQAV